MTPKRQLRVYFLPSLVGEDELADTTAVVIDVLRATTTIVHAMASGATEVIPCLEVDTARKLATQHHSMMLGGERKGLRIDGFHLGNSPAEYTPEIVGGKSVVMTTTNGTKAMLHCREAKQVLIAAFVNFSAVCHRLSNEVDIAIVCAGTNGEITREDVLLAGAISAELLATTNPPEPNDQALLAIDAWRDMQVRFSGVELVHPLRESFGGRNLIEIGQERDIEIAATIDKFDIVPVYSAGEGRISLR